MTIVAAPLRREWSPVSILRLEIALTMRMAEGGSRSRRPLGGSTGLDEDKPVASMLIHGLTAGPAPEPMVARISQNEIVEENRFLALRHRHFRVAADAMVGAWSPLATVLRIALIGSVARPLWKEVPRFAPYRRARIELWHECKDLDLALWLSALDELPMLNRLRGKTLTRLTQTDGIGVAHHQVDVFVLEPGSDRYLGRLCTYGTCPKGKPECRVPACGDHAFLQQIEGFSFDTDTLAPDRCVVLFDRLGRIRRRATDLPTGDATHGTA